MSASLQSELQAFLSVQQQPSLLAYLGLDPSSPGAVRRRALQTRRAWAQQQRNNPKYREECDWLLRRGRFLESALLSELPPAVDPETMRAAGQPLEEQVREVMSSGLMPESWLTELLRMVQSGALTNQQGALLLHDEVRWRSRLAATTAL